jgi:hypothetical protein
MHHIGVVRASEDVARSSHVGGKLINFIKPAINHVSHEIGIAKIPNHKVVGLGRAEAGKFEVGTADPKALPLQAPHQVMTDETTSPAYQSNLSCLIVGHSLYPY